MDEIKVNIFKSSDEGKQLITTSYMLQVPSVKERVVINDYCFVVEEVEWHKNYRWEAHLLVRELV